MKRKILLTIILILVLGTILKVIDFENIILRRTHQIKYEEYVYKFASECNVDELLIFSIIRVESNFNERSFSASGAKGLMQLMDSTADELATGLNMPEDFDIYDVETNIKLGTNYMSILLKYYNGSLNLALAAYNAGIGNVNSWIEEGIIKEDGSDIENIPFKETNNYVRKVLRDYRIYAKLYG